MMIPRDITPEFQTLLREYPVVTLLGPRQSGKTTLATGVLPDYAYVNLEVPDHREFATVDPKAFLAKYPGPVVIDEIQRVPELLSYIQAIVDQEDRPGRFVLTGSHQLRLRDAVSQSLAGRTALLHLLPFSIGELTSAGISFPSFEDYALHGFLPRIHDKGIRPGTAYSNYYQTYVERDVRQLIHLKDSALFEKLLRLLAGRTGQLVDYTSLANDVGVDAKTIRNWLSILEASFILFRLPPYYENFGKRMIKAPKIYFTDVGLLCFLLGIRETAQVSQHPLVGAVFENLVILDILKKRFNQGQRSNLYFMRDSKGVEADLVLESNQGLQLIEIKSAATFSRHLLRGIQRFQDLSSDTMPGALVYSGEEMDLSDGTRVVHFKNAAGLAE